MNLRCNTNISKPLLSFLKIILDSTCHHSDETNNKRYIKYNNVWPSNAIFSKILVKITNSDSWLISTSKKKYKAVFLIWITYPGVRYPKENHYLLVVPICRMRSCFLTRSRCSRMNSHSLKQIFSVDQMIRAWHCLHHLMLI